MKQKAQFYVLNWDFNRDEIEHYDVLPYFRNEFKERKKKSKSKRIQRIMEETPDMKKYYGVPETRDELKKFIENESQYMFWGRCQYEMIVHGWPVRKNDYKIDVHEQVMMNIDIITDILYKELIDNK